MTKPGKTSAMRTFGDHEEASHIEAPKRPVWQAMARGAFGTCPNCGKGRLFTRWLAVDPHCNHCGEELFHHRADDLPAYLNIFVTGHVVIGVMMLFLDSEFLPVWGLTVMTAAIAVAVAAAMMRPLKGMVVGAQWALSMHGFGGHDD